MLLAAYRLVGEMSVMGSRTAARVAALLAGCVVVLLPGVVPVARGLAAGGTAATGGSALYNSGGWAMVKPQIPVTTRLVHPFNRVRGTDISAFALRYVGYPYTLTGNSPQLGFSCIGFVSYVYRSLGIPLPDDLDNAIAYAPRVGMRHLKRGDILWFANTVWPGLSHTAIYLGGGRFVHAAWFGRGVIVSSLRHDRTDGSYWIQHYLGASRPWGGWVFAQAVPLATIDPVPGLPVMLVASQTAQMRAWNSTRAPVREVLQRATPLTVLRAQGHWYRITAPDGLTGWIAGAPAARSQRARLRPAITTPQRFTVHYPSPVPHARAARHTRRPAPSVRRAHRRPVHTRGATTRRAGHRGASASRARHRAVQASSHGTRLRRATVTVRIRATPSLHGRVIGLIAAGKTVRSTGTRGAWTRIVLRGHGSGYVYARYLR